MYVGDFYKNPWIVEHISLRFLDFDLLLANLCKLGFSIQYYIIEHLLCDHNKDLATL